MRYEKVYPNPARTEVYHVLRAYLLGSGALDSMKLKHHNGDTPDPIYLKVPEGEEALYEVWLTIKPMKDEEEEWSEVIHEGKMWRN